LDGGLISVYMDRLGFGRGLEKCIITIVNKYKNNAKIGNSFQKRISEMKSYSKQKLSSIHFQSCCIDGIDAH
jgi:hypothetical protein